MAAPTIPVQLAQDIRNRRVSLIVGVGIGFPSWKQVLERMNDELRSRGHLGDAAAAADVDQLLARGRFVRAAGFLARRLGEPACDRHVAQMWSTGETPPDVARALARLPFKHVWTTFPGDALERAMETERPDDWPLPEVRTYRNVAGVDRRRRTLVKLLGDFESFVVTPKSIRRALSGASDLREFIRDEYAQGTLVLVGFRDGDPDLAALLDRLFGSLEPPESHHYLIASGVGPVTVDELATEHHLEVINLAGRGADETATAALIEFLEALGAECERAQLTLAQTRPDDDDLEGWLGVWAERPDDAEARAAVLAIEAAAEAAGDSERLVEALMARAEIEPTPAERAAVLRRVADVFETRIGDVPRAFTALTASLRENPSDTSAVDEAERLAEAADGWTELVADVADVAGEITDPAVASIYFAKLGRWYHARLAHMDYAIAAYREALRRDRHSVAAHVGLADVFRAQQRWSDLADELAAQLELPPGSVDVASTNLALGELCETQLAQTPRAIEAYQAAADADDTCEDALVALERLYRRAERWGKLAMVLERRAQLFDVQGESARASVTRRELAALRADKLGDLEGAIARCEAQLVVDPADVGALRQLEDLYQKVGRRTEYLRTLDRLSDAVPASERATVLRHLAGELEDRDDGRDKAIECYTRVLEIEPAAEDAFRALERIFRHDSRWDELVGVLEQHVAIARAPAVQAELWSAIAAACEKHLGRPERAIEAHREALAVDEGHRESQVALARLYQAGRRWDRAADMLGQLARADGDGAAGWWAQAAQLHAEHLDDPDRAQQEFEKALELSPDHLGALVGLARLHRARGAWASAVQRFVDAAGAAGNRLERIEHLSEAAAVCARELDDADRALELHLRVLELDPEHASAGRAAADRLLALGRHDQALPILEALARRGGDADPATVCRREAELAQVCRELGMRQKAARHYRAAAAAEPNDVGAALGLASTLFDEAEAIGARERWDDAERAYRDLLTRHRPRLDAAAIGDAWHRIGRAARAGGDSGKAEDAFRRALEQQPESAPVLESLADLLIARADWRGAIELLRRLARASEPERKVALFEQIGDLAADKLSDRDGALVAYRQAIELRPDAHQILHKTLDIHSAARNWRQAIETLEAIARTADPVRKAKYHYAAAVIARDELRDADLAISQFQAALADDPDLTKAFDALDELFTARHDWKSVARLYRKLLKRLGDGAPVDRLLQLWSRLGDICVDHLDDLESAIAAYEVALSLAPDDLERHEQLANLYLEAGDARRADAIAELQILIERAPDRVELYRALSGLYLEEGELDKAFCLAQTLMFLGAATETERALYERLKPPQFVVAKRKLTEELWQRSILHRGQDRHLNAIFSSVCGSIASTTAQPPEAFHIARPSEADKSRTVAKVFHYAANVLAIEPEPRLHIQPDSGDGLRVANTADRGKLVPTVVVGSPQADKTSERELAFEVGKRLAYMRPEHYMHYATQTLSRLEMAYHAALAAAGARNAPAPGDAEVDRLADHLRRTVPEAVLEQVGAVANRMTVPPGNGIVASWRTATDLSANRIGFILCNDLETAARLVATEPPGASPLSTVERLRDLLAYSVSEEYFAVRRHLGIAVSAEAAAERGQYGRPPVLPPGP